MVDERFHALLHRRARWRDKLVVIDLNGTGRYLVQALQNVTQFMSDV